VVSGGGNDPSAARDARTEGIRVGASIGTHLHGPFLPMNPQIADELLRAALTHHGASAEQWADAEQVRVVDEAAAKSRQALASRLGVRI
jgi:CobQ-like glutamine amidotransferase family enzyme